MATQDYNTIEKELHQKLHLRPTDVETLLQLAVFHIDNPSQAHYFTSEILKIDPFNLYAFIVYIDLEHNWIGSFDNKALLKQIAAFEERYPHNGYIDLLYAEHFEILKQHAKVRMHLQRSINKNPEWVRNNKLMGLYYYYHDHNYNMAKKMFLKALSNIQTVHTTKSSSIYFTDAALLFKEKYYETTVNAVTYQILIENIKTCNKKLKKSFHVSQ